MLWQCSSRLSHDTATTRFRWCWNWLTEDGQPAQIQVPPGPPQNMRIEQMITVASPGGVPSGTPGTGNTLLEILPGLPLTPGGYEWLVTLDGEHDESWSARFRVIAPEARPNHVREGAPS